MSSTRPSSLATRTKATPTSGLSALQIRVLRDVASATATLQRGVEAIPTSGPLHNHLGYALLEQGRSPEAIRALEAYVTLSPGEPNAHDSLADPYLTAGQPDRALAELNRAPREAQRIDISSAAHLLAGVALARSGDLEGARKHLDEQENLDPSTEDRRWWHGALAGEIALAEGDLAAAESAFAGAEPKTRPAGLSNFGASAFRDGRARVKVARGGVAGALEAYRALNTPGIANRWVALLEPRFVLEVARLLDQLGRHEEARQEYERFLELWKDADEGLPELAEARAYVARRDRPGSPALAPGGQGGASRDGIHDLEEWEVLDQLTMLQQLGVVSLPA